MKKCPLLISRGFLTNKGSLRPEKIWIEEACRDCPLDKAKGYCVYDKAGAVTGEEIRILLGGEDEDCDDFVG